MSSAHGRPAWSKCWKLLMLKRGEDDQNEMATVGGNIYPNNCIFVPFFCQTQELWWVLWHHAWSKLAVDLDLNFYFITMFLRLVMILHQHVWDCFRLSGCLMCEREMWNQGGIDSRLFGRLMIWIPACFHWHLFSTLIPLTANHCHEGFLKTSFSCSLQVHSIGNWFKWNLLKTNEQNLITSCKTWQKKTK